MGMRVNLGAAMIAAVSMGLSVDSSLHYLIRFQRERALGKTFFDALESAQSEIGMAMLLSTLALVVGFGALATSDFLPTVVFGVLGLKVPWFALTVHVCAAFSLTLALMTGN